MRIHFTCQCGKSLRARPSMAGRGTICPACRSPVRIPALDATSSPETAAGRNTPHKPTQAAPQPLRTERENPFVADRRIELPPPARRNLYRAKPRNAQPQIVSPTEITLRNPPRWWKLISHPGAGVRSRGFSFEIPHIPIFLRLAAVLTLLTLVALAAWLSPGEKQIPRMALLAFCGLGIITILGYVCRYLDAVVLVASHGMRYEPSINADPFQAALSGARWLLKFLAGPALLAFAGVAYWIYCGELTVVDYIILAELTLAAAGWWLIALVIAASRRCTGIPSPAIVLKTVLAMKRDTAQWTLLATLLVAGHGLAIWFSIAWVHEHLFLGVLLMLSIWASFLYFSAFAFRHLGLALHRLDRREGQTAANPSENSSPRPSCWVPAPQWDHNAQPKH